MVTGFPGVLLAHVVSWCTCVGPKQVKNEYRHVNMQHDNRNVLAQDHGHATELQAVVVNTCAWKEMERSNDD
jgi:hypothetical protein